MNRLMHAKWITSPSNQKDVCPIFKKDFMVSKPIKRAQLYISSLGMYEAALNGERIGDFIFSPGWTSYHTRLQFQMYDITEKIKEENQVCITVGKGWYASPMGWKHKDGAYDSKIAVIATIHLTYEDSESEEIHTDSDFLVAESPILFSEIYDGEMYDATKTISNWEHAVAYEHSKEILIPQEGESIKEIESLPAIQLIITPKGERVIDFGQNLTGYVRFSINACAGDVCEISHAEVLDREGNFYTENLRSAKQKITYICRDGLQTYAPHFTFQGFRYIRIDQWPHEIVLKDICAVVVHSDLKRTGNFQCSHELLNQLYRNIIWGQKGNFLDVPTDCPQRNERLGWTGDAQVFVRTASYNFDVEKFFTKWLRDLKADQFKDGGVPHVIPNILDHDGNSAAWGDAAVICPWQIYLIYDNKQILAEQYESMKEWVEYIRRQGENEYLWHTGKHFGDWLGLDAEEGSYKGSTDESLIATAFYAYSTSLLIKAGKVLEKDMSEYEQLYTKILEAFDTTFVQDGKLISNTQTAHALVLCFNLTKQKQEMAQSLAELVRQNGNRLTTGFVGTPYLLHALSNNGYVELAYSLILQEDYPSWLYSVKKGATTIWEHWDGIKPDGTMWSKDMNSFNHYAYGAVADWMYGVMAGINMDEQKPGFKHTIFKPITDDRIDFVKASIETRYGLISSEWKKAEGKVLYQFAIPSTCTGTIILGEKQFIIKEGECTFSIMI